MNMPWMQFHTRDWLDNKELRRCSLAARAVLADLMCLAHEGVPYGYLCDKFGPLSDEFMAARCFMDVTEFRHTVIELLRFERINAEGEKYYINRMVKDFQANEARRKNGKSGGRPKLAVVPNNLDNLEPNQVVTVQVSDLEPKTEPPSDSDSGSKSKLSSKPQERKVFELDEQWTEFATIARLFWIDLIPEDLSGWRFGWNALDPEQKALAITNLKARIEAGQIYTKVFKPTYFSHGEWKRPVARSPPQPAQKSNYELQRQQMIQRPNPRLTPGA